MMMMIGVVDLSCIAVADTVTMELCVWKVCRLGMQCMWWAWLLLQQNDWFKHALVCRRPSSIQERREISTENPIQRNQEITL